MRNVLVAVVVVLATTMHASVWFVLHERVSPPNTNGALASVSFSPIDPKQDAEEHATTEAQIRSDLEAIAPYTRTVRTYSVNSGLEVSTSDEENAVDRLMPHMTRLTCAVCPISPHST